MRSIGLSAVVSFFMVIGVLCCCYNSHAAITLLPRYGNMVVVLRQHDCCATATWLSQNENNGKRVKKTTESRPLLSSYQILRSCNRTVRRAALSTLAARARV